VAICPGCGEENPDRFRLCGFCGTPLRPEAAPQELRRTVTVVFCDLKDSTALGERLDAEALREVVGRYFAAMREVLESHGGTIEKFIGDAVMAVFGVPRLHEDDALRAVRAAAAMQQSLAALNDELDRRYGVRLACRTGVNTGEVIAGDPSAGQRLVTGDAVNVAARLEQAAGAGEVLVGELTHRLVRDATELQPVKPLTLKGKSEPTPAWRVVRASRSAAPDAHDGRIIGRDEQLARLDAALRRVAAERRPRLVLLTGPAGIGKSRLVTELALRMSGAAGVLRGRCLPYGRGITFWPLVEIVREAAAIQDGDGPYDARRKLAAFVGDDAVADRVMAAMGLAGADQFPLGELFWGVRKLLEAAAAARPVTVVLEDLHWAESTLLEFVRHLVESSTVPLLVVATARETFSERADWSDPADTEHLALEPLGGEALTAIIADALGDDALDDRVTTRIVETADGNPLFARQLLSMLVADGRLRRVADWWVATGDIAELELPPTIQALLDARLDRLSPAARAVIGPASVIGLEFSLAAVHAMVPETSPEDVSRHLRSLVGLDLVHPEDDGSGGEAFRFHHITVRDAAYRALLKRDRAVLHERFAAWMQAGMRAREEAGELDEILGYHLEQAHRYLDQLGPLDDHGRGLGARAARRLATAGRRAFARGDMPAAANLLRRAAGLLPEDDRDRLELLPALGEALIDTGEFAWAQIFLDEAVRHAGEARLAARARIVAVRARQHATDPTGWSEDAVREACEALAIFEQAGDDAGLAASYRLLASAHGTACRYGDAAAAARAAIEYATAAGDDWQRRWASSQYAITATYGPTPVEQAVPDCEAILAQSDGDRRTEGLTMSLLARLEAMRGDFDRARTLSSRARTTLDELGRSVVAASTSLDSCGVDILAGDPAAAERNLRRDSEALSEMGETYLLSTIAAELARAVVLQGRDDEAEELTVTAEELTADDDIASQALWRSVRAKVLARRGDLQAAGRMATDAVELLRRTDAVVTLGDALLDLGEVLESCGDLAAAHDAFDEAALLFERKGNVVAAASARAALARTSAATA
jgi:class 3 adenylate cyclase/tetratricopeptide (TPR) repeat protein